MLDDVAIVGIGETEKSRAREDKGEEYYSLEEYYARAARMTLDSAGMEKTDVEGFGIINPGEDTPFIYPSMLSQTMGFEDQQWMISADNGGSSPLSLLLQGALAVQAGIVDTFLCLGADTPIDPHSEGGGREPRGYVKNYLDTFGTQGPNERMAHVQTVHMDEYGTSIEQLGEISVSQRRHAAMNDLAYFDEEVSLDDYVDAPMIADPIRLLDCVPPVNGGFGVMLTNTDIAADLDAPSVYVHGFGECHNHDIGGTPDMTRTGLEMSGRLACEMADVDPTDAGFVQPYDDYPIIVAMSLEDLGVCEKGDGGRFVQETDLMYDGEMPVNTAGGQLSAGQAGLAGGYLQLVEGIRQLRGEAGDRQIPDAEWGLVTGVGGVEYGKNLRNTNVAVLSEVAP